MPELVEKNDLIADCTEEQAHARLSNVTNAFLILNGPSLDKATLNMANYSLMLRYNETIQVSAVCYLP